MNGPGYVLDLLMTQVIERVFNLPLNLLICRARYAYTTRVRQLFNPCRQIDVVPIDIVTVVYDLAEINSNPKLQALIFRHLGIPLSHLPLELDGTVNCCCHALKFCQDGISRFMHFLAARQRD